MRMHVRRPFVELGRLQDQRQKLVLVTASCLIPFLPTQIWSIYRSLLEWSPDLSRDLPGDSLTTPLRATRYVLTVQR